MVPAQRFVGLCACVSLCVLVSLSVACLRFVVCSSCTYGKCGGGEVADFRSHLCSLFVFCCVVTVHVVVVCGIPLVVALSAVLGLYVECRASLRYARGSRGVGCTA